MGITIIAAIIGIAVGLGIGFEKVAITLRESHSAFDNGWSAMLYDGENYCFSKK